MKRFLAVALFVVLVMALVNPTAYAQNAFNKKDMILSAGIGLGMYGLYGSSTLPPIFLAFETGVADKITAGGIVAYSGSSEDFVYGKWKYSYVVIAARASYHFLENNKNIDAYAGAGLGYDIVSSSVEYRDPTVQRFASAYSAGASYFFFDVHLGARYYFSPKFAAMGELGYGVGFLRLGVSYKLN